jgi:hypothetical protein
VLVVETVDDLSAELKATQQGVGDGLSEVREVSDQRARLMERACSELSDEVRVGPNPNPLTLTLTLNPIPTLTLILTLTLTLTQA